MKDIKKYLIEKVDKTIVNHPKANAGAALLKLNKTYKDDLDNLLIETIKIIQRLFIKTNNGSMPGESPLTNMSMKIGKKVYSMINREPVTWEQELRLGDLFIEALYNLGYIDLSYPAIRNSSHMVHAGPRWVELRDMPSFTDSIKLTATTLHKPADLKEHGEQKSVVKHGGKYELHTPFTRAINRLQQTKWRINTKVFNALKKANGFTSSKREKNQSKEEKRRSKIIEWTFIETKANQLIDKDFYQLISADYRGRLYYDEAFLNFQGPDLARGIMQFSEPKVMTEKDTFWLAIYTAAAFNQSYDIDEIPDWCEADYKSHLEEEGLESISVDKMTLNDRCQWTQENIENIIELGKNCKFAKDAEKKVTFLACCIEWYEYSIEDGEYLSCLPISIDGSNNGWQHLGAMSKDSQTGSLVGLIPTEIQKDFYVQTAKELIIQAEKDEELSSILHSMPMKHIRKGITKRGSMTRAYSAGAEKIGLNMWTDCRVEDFHDRYDITEEHCIALAKLLIKAIDIVCPGPLKTMAYFQDLAAFEIGKTAIDSNLIKRRRELIYKKGQTDEELKEISDINATIDEQASELVYGNGNDRITWTTPSGFEVDYEKWRMKVNRCKGSIVGYRRVNHVVHMPSDKPDLKRFMQGISPNFTHSQDSAHMCLVIDSWPHTFGAVHDSFSTHACDVEELLELTKEKFIEIYSIDNFYERIAEELVTDHRELDIEPPELGDLDVENIRESDYFFS